MAIASPEFIKQLPKAELHLHIEGSLEPEQMMSLADKHGIDLPYKSLADIRSAYQFNDLQSFLYLYYLGASVLIDEQDFYDLMWAYLCRCREEKIIHTEIMFDPQTHTDRGIAFETVMNGFDRALSDAKSQWGQSSSLIMSFLRHLSEDAAMQTLEAALDPPEGTAISAGLGSSRTLVIGISFNRGGPAPRRPASRPPGRSPRGRSPDGRPAPRRLRAAPPRPHPG